MSNYSWVCFECKLAVRRATNTVEVRCARCRGPCACLGYKIPVPPKSKLKEWQRLREFVYRWRRESYSRQQRLRVRRIHDLEYEIAHLEALPRNEGRAAAVKVLMKRLEEAHANPSFLRTAFGGRC